MLGKGGPWNWVEAESGLAKHGMNLSPSETCSVLALWIWFVFLVSKIAWMQPRCVFSAKTCFSDLCPFVQACSGGSPLTDHCLKCPHPQSEDMQEVLTCTCTCKHSVIQTILKSDIQYMFLVECILYVVVTTCAFTTSYQLLPHNAYQRWKTCCTCACKYMHMYL